MCSKLELPTVVIHTKKEIMEIVVTKSLKKAYCFTWRLLSISIDLQNSWNVKINNKYIMQCSLVRTGLCDWVLGVRMGGRMFWVVFLNYFMDTNGLFAVCPSHKDLLKSHA